jgi:hypothetical protein
MWGLQRVRVMRHGLDAMMPFIPPHKRMLDTRERLFQCQVPVAPAHSLVHTAIYAGMSRTTSVNLPELIS